MHIVNSSLKRAKQIRLMFVSNCTVCGKKKSRFIKNQEASGLLCDLILKIPTNKTPTLANVFLRR